MHTQMHVHLRDTRASREAAAGASGVVNGGPTWAFAGTGRCMGVLPPDAEKEHDEHDD